MIAAHRRRHRRIFGVLAVVLPLLLLLALRARPRWPLLRASPAEVGESMDPDPSAGIEAVTLFQGNGAGG
jgi:hypothetical protein